MTIVGFNFKKISAEKKEALRIEADKIAEVRRLILESIANAEGLMQED